MPRSVKAKSYLLDTSGPYEPYEAPTLDWRWSHCVAAGEDIGDVLLKLISWHFDEEHVPIVEKWLMEREAMHDAVQQLLHAEK